MLKIEENYNLEAHNTLKLKAQAQYFAIVTNKEELMEAIKFAKEKNIKVTVLGGGSNVVCQAQIEGLVIKNEIRGKRIVSETEDETIISAYSGEIWTRLVAFSAEHNLYGLENLYLIYGTVGAAPVQNIGAYGVELKDTFLKLRAFDLTSGKERIFSKEECQFAYRDSIFKREYKGRYFIYEVFFTLSKRKKLKLDYGSINKTLLERGINEPQLKDVIETIASIREQKLPSPYRLPNAGSFFKNPEVSVETYQTLKEKFPDMPCYQCDLGYKIAAGWLIDQAGFRGKDFAGVRMYEKQALVLINEGGDVDKIFQLSRLVQEKVKAMFGLDLELEVNII